MARGVNQVILIGHLGDDPETKYTQNGDAITTARLATTQVRKDRDGNTQEYTEWHRIKFFGKLAEIAGEYLRKGSQCYINGRIHYDKYTAQDGTEKFYTDIIANEMQMLGGRGEGGGQQGGQRQQQRRDQPRQSQQQSSRPQRQAPAPQQQEQRDFGDDFADDDIPF